MSESTTRNIRRKLTDLRSRIKRETPPEELSDYEVHIEHKRPGILSRIFSRFSRQEQEILAEEIKEEPKEIKEEMEDIAEEYETINEAEDELEKKKEGLFQKFVKLLTPKPKEEDVPIDEVEEAMGVVKKKETEDAVLEIKEDLKRISKITLFLISELTHAKQNHFKESEEFREYKDILKKHGLVK